MSEPVDEAVRKLALRLAQEEWPTMKDSHDEDAKLFERVLTEQLAPLLRAAKLAELHFRRNHASGNWQGDDEHEAWTAISTAWAKLTGRTP